MARQIYSTDPTARDEERAQELRAWYENNRETWWDRFTLSRNKQLLHAGCSDGFILDMQQEAIRIAIDAGYVVYPSQKEE